MLAADGIFIDTMSLDKASRIFRRLFLFNLGMSGSLMVVYPSFSKFMEQIVPGGY